MNRMNLCALVATVALPTVALANPLVLDSNGDDLALSTSWDAANNRLVVDVAPDDFIHLRIDRTRLFETGQIPLQVFGAAVSIDVTLRTFDAGAGVLSHRTLSATSSTPGRIGGVGTTVGGAGAVSAELIIEFGWPQSVTPPDTTNCCGTGDVNCDLVLDSDDTSDFATLLANEDVSSDVNGDGCYDQSDLDDFLNVVPLSPCYQP